MASVEPFTRRDGTIYYRARILLADGTRERVDVPEKYAYSEERRAMYAAAVQEREDERGEILAKKRERIAAKQTATLPPVGPETVARYRDRLNLHRDELGKGKGDPSAWKAWINPRLGPLPMATVPREEIETFRDTLDAQIATHKRTEGREGLSPKRALNIWSEVTTTFKAAVNAKQRDLRVRTDNPCDGVEPPEKGDSKRKTFIYPAELHALLSGDAPLEWREVYAIGSYLYLRPGELRALTWGDVDTSARVVHVTKAYDEREGETKTPKTARGVRDVPIPPTLLPLLERMQKDREPSELVVPILGKLTENRRATNIRLDLQRAGVTRPRLFEDTATTMGVNFRSLRDSGITWLALAGVDVVRMQRRAGHESLETTGSYIKAAEDFTGTIGEPFGPLPASLLDGVEPQGGGGSRQRLGALRRGAQQSGQKAKSDPKSPSDPAEGAKNSASLEVRAGLVNAEPAKNKAFRQSSHPNSREREDVSSGSPVDARPSDRALGIINPAPPGGVSSSPRATMIATLAQQAADAVAAGDMEAARIAHAAMGSLLASATAEPAGVVDLAAERAKRGAP